ncbi:hypothetical protein HK098_004970 [Nowakowskiella sp. JEL0407]|nr:hypothetical protein HK098_004970 [Nowakowskiella sp. JEL0407]
MVSIKNRKKSTGIIPKTVPSANVEEETVVEKPASKSQTPAYDISNSSPANGYFDERVLILAEKLDWKKTFIPVPEKTHSPTSPPEKSTPAKDSVTLNGKEPPQQRHATKSDFEELEKFAKEENDASACALYALCLHTGSFIERDDKEGMIYLLTAVGLATTKASEIVSDKLNALESLHEKKNSVSNTAPGAPTKNKKSKKKKASDVSIAENMNKKSLSEHHQLALLLFMLGDWNRNGIGMAADFNRAFHNLRQSIQFDRTNKDSLFVFASMYERGDGVIADQVEAFKLYLESANLGSLAAMFKIGQAYEWGKGTAVDYYQAKLWYSKAALQNHFPSTVRLAILSLDPAYETFEDLKEAATQVKTGLAMHNYAIAKSTQRHGLPVNHAEMKTWLIKAAKSGHVRSQWLLGRMYDEGISGFKQDSKLSFYWYQQAALQGYQPAQWAVSNMYRHGLGTEQDTALADKWQHAATRNVDQKTKPCVDDNACPVIMSLKETKSPDWNSMEGERPFSVLTPFSTAAELGAAVGTVSNEFINTTTTLGIGIVGMPGFFKFGVEMQDKLTQNRKRSLVDQAEENTEESKSISSEPTLYDSFCSESSFPTDIDFVKYSSMSALLNILPRRDGLYFQDSHFTQSSHAITISTTPNVKAGSLAATVLGSTGNPGKSPSIRRGKNSASANNTKKEPNPDSMIQMYTSVPTLAQINIFRETHEEGVVSLFEAKSSFLKGESLVQHERYPEAVECFLLGFRSFEGMLDLTNYNSRLLAAIAAQWVLVRDPTNASALLLDVFLNFLVRPHELTIVKLNKVLKARRDDVAALVMSASVKAKLLMFEEALKDLDSALEAEEPGRQLPELHYQRGTVFSNMPGKDNKQRAINNFDHYLNLVGIDGRRVPDAYYSIAGCFLELGNVRKVVENFSRGLETEVVRFPFFSINSIVNASLKASLTFEVKYMLITGGSHIRQQPWSKINQKYLHLVEGEEHNSIAKECVACGSLGQTKICGGCKEQRYCSTNCQIAHWVRGHAKECTKKP